jgi:hypothetical protein
MLAKELHEFQIFVTLCCPLKESSNEQKWKKKKKKKKKAKNHLCEIATFEDVCNVTVNSSIFTFKSVSFQEFSDFNVVRRISHKIIPQCSNVSSRATNKYLVTNCD